MSFYKKYPASGGSSGVDSINTLTGALTLVAGAGIDITTGVGTITIEATGGGSPGGASGDVQFNDGGDFGGDASLHWNTTNQSLSITGADGSTVPTLVLEGDYRQIGFYHNYEADPNARAWALYTNNPNSGELALLISEDEVSEPSVRVWSLDNQHEMFMWQNDKWFYQRNTANNGFVGMIKVDASDNIQINDSPTNIILNGSSGIITIATAIASGLQFQDGSEGTSGYVWTSTGTDGEGTWMPATGGGSVGAAGEIQYSDGAGGFDSSTNFIINGGSAMRLNGATGSQPFNVAGGTGMMKLEGTVNWYLGVDSTGDAYQVGNASQEGVFRIEAAAAAPSIVIKTNGIGTIEFSQHLDMKGNDVRNLSVLSSTTSGADPITMTASFFRLPTQSSDPGSPVEGACYWNTTLNVMRVYNGTVWQTVTAV